MQLPLLVYRFINCSAGNIVQEVHESCFATKSLRQPQGSISIIPHSKTLKKADSMTFGPQANYTDLATAAIGEVVLTFSDTEL
jgi:hypothetical protein